MRSAAITRADLLSEPHRSEVRNLLREYRDVRLESVEPGKLGRNIARFKEIHARLWGQPTAAGRENPASIVVGLFIGSLN